MHIIILSQKVGWLDNKGVVFHQLSHMTWVVINNRKSPILDYQLYGQ
jgi:hypothetical protein